MEMDENEHEKEDNKSKSKSTRVLPPPSSFLNLDQQRIDELLRGSKKRRKDQEEGDEKEEVAHYDDVENGALDFFTSSEWIRCFDRHAHDHGQEQEHGETMTVTQTMKMTKVAPSKTIHSESRPIIHPILGTIVPSESTPSFPSSCDSDSATDSRKRLDSTLTLTFPLRKRVANKRRRQNSHTRLRWRSGDGLGIPLSLLRFPPPTPQTQPPLERQHALDQAQYLERNVSSSSDSCSETKQNLKQNGRLRIVSSEGATVRNRCDIDDVNSIVLTRLKKSSVRRFVRARWLPPPKIDDLNDNKDDNNEDDDDGNRKDGVVDDAKESEEEEECVGVVRYQICLLPQDYRPSRIDNSNNSDSSNDYDDNYVDDNEADKLDKENGWDSNQDRLPNGDYLGWISDRSRLADDPYDIVQIVD